MAPSSRAALVALLAAAALLPVLWPLFESGVPVTHDGHLHIQRTMALERLVDSGVVFSRWLPEFAFGYGMPLFNYYAPLVYVPLVAARQLGATFIDSYKLTAALTLVGSAAAMYLCARSVMGPLGSLVAALLYAYLPYQLVNLYVRGALAESAAFVWAPLGCWAVVKLRGSPSPARAIVLAFCIAGLILTHNVTALLFTPCLAFLVLVLAARGCKRSKYLRAAAIGFLGGLGLSAWFWVPAMLERDWVQIEALIEPELFASFFLTRWPPFQLSPSYDYREPSSIALGSPIYWPLLGLVQVATVILAAPVALRSQGIARALAVWSIMLIVGGVALQLGFAAPVYNFLPLVGFIQFPWRLLAVVGLGSAILVGIAVDSLWRRRWIGVTAAAMVVALSIWTATTRLSPAYEYPEDRFVNAEAQTRLELANFGLGSTHGGEYLPTTTGRPNANRLWKDLSSADSSTGASREDSKTNVVPEEIRILPIGLRGWVSAPRADKLMLHQFYFPGWIASVDGRPAAVEPAGRFGLVSIDIPEGRHYVEIELGWTWARLVALIVSGLAAVGLGCYLLVPVVVRRRPWVSRRARAAASVGAAALVAGGCLFQGPTAGQRSVAPTAGVLASPDERLRLVGSRLDDSRLLAGGPFLVQVEMDWQSLSAQPRQLSLVVAAEHGNGERHEARWAYGPLVRSLEPGEFFHTQTNLRLPPGFPPGEARVMARFEGMQPPLGAWTELGAVIVPERRGAQGPAFAERAAIDLLPGVALHSFELRVEGRSSASIVRAGEALDLNLELRVAGPPRQDLLAIVELRGPEFRARSDPHTLGSWYLPPSAWQAGDRFSQQIRLAAPRGLPAGSAEVRLLIYESGGPWSGLAPHSSFAPAAKGAPAADVALGSLETRP